MKKLIAILLLTLPVVAAFAGGQDEAKAAKQNLRIAAPPWIFKKFPLEDACSRIAISFFIDTS